VASITGEEGTWRLPFFDACVRKEVYAQQYGQTSKRMAEANATLECLLTSVAPQMFPFGLIGNSGEPEHELDLAGLDMRHSIAELSFGADALELHAEQTSDEAGAPSTYTPLSFFGVREIDVGQLIE
jgi:hypothetical protein